MVQGQKSPQCLFCSRIKGHLCRDHPNVKYHLQTASLRQLSNRLQDAEKKGLMAKRIPHFALLLHSISLSFSFPQKKKKYFPTKSIHIERFSHPVWLLIYSVFWCEYLFLWETDTTKITFQKSAKRTVSAFLIITMFIVEALGYL